MITPQFQCSQDDEFVTVRIRVPHVKVEEMEFYVMGQEFKFFVKPYFLRLTFAHSLVEDERAVSTYDVGAGVVECRLPKELPGQYFGGLDMLSELLAPPHSQREQGRLQREGKPLIEVLGEMPAQQESEEEEEEAEGDGGGDFKEEWEKTQEWEEVMQQQVPVWGEEEEEEEEAARLLRQRHGYGFNRSYHDFFEHLQAELAEIAELSEPEDTPLQERRRLRLLSEQDKFDPEYYMADFMEDASIQEVMQFRARWQREKRVMRSGKQASPHEDYLAHCPFTERERDAMIALPRKEFLLEPSERVPLLLGLVDLLLAYAYNHRTMFGENTVESAWTISTLASTLSWFDHFGSVSQCLVAFCRRALCYPLYRHWGLCVRVIRDVLCILKLGPGSVVRALLEIKYVLDHSETRYLFCKVCVNDYCAWAQKLREEDTRQLHDVVREAAHGLRKESVDLDLVSFEELALEGDREIAMEEEDTGPPLPL